MAAAAIELAVAPEITSLAEAFTAENIDLLFFKGAALAYTDYPSPHLRPRGDSDILIRTTDTANAGEVLRQMGYSHQGALSTPGVSQQTQYVRPLRSGVVHTVDLHWRTFNPAVFQTVLPFDEMWRDRRRVAPLGRAAWAPGPVHALVLALVHRLAHHEPGERLLWLFDIHLLAKRLTASEWQAFVAYVDSHELSALCAQGLDTTRDYLTTPVPPEIEKWISTQRARPVPARFSAFTKPGRRVFDMVASDLGASLTWRDQLSLVREHLLPPPAYVSSRYGGRDGWWLPLLYVHRAATGAWRWFRRDLFR